LGTLYVCSTPIGNLSDCTFRLIDILKNVHKIAAEDTRTVRKLLSHFGITTPVFSLQMHNENQRISEVASYLADGKDIALVSDAGTPNISDPGAHLIKQLSLKEIPVSPVVGASAISAILSVSGILANQFIFGGFFPKKRQQIGPILKIAEDQALPVVCFDSPNRLMDNLRWLNENHAIDYLCVGKELTKKFETLISGSVEEVMGKLENTTLKGEWCYVFTLCKPTNNAQDPRIRHLFDLGVDLKQMTYIGKELLGISKSDIYKKFLEMKSDESTND
jgi:16S rRNA (cytidine1402-2'-O)-methyltransferase